MQRHVKGIWIPIEVWLNDELTPTEKIILMEIDSLDDGVTGCYATDKYIAEFSQCSTDKVKDAIGKLKRLGLITVEKSKSRYRRLHSTYSVKNTEFGETYSVKNTECNSVKNTECNKDINNTTRKKEDIPPTPCETIRRLYNEICTDLPTCRELTDARTKDIQRIWKEHPDVSYFEQIFRKMQASDFLTGKVKEWRANFDFWLNDRKRARIAEGAYDNKQTAPKGETSFDVNEFFRRATKK